MADEDDIAKKKGTWKLTPSQWTEVEELWALGDHTLDELGERYGISPEYLSREMSRRGVKKGSRAGVLRDKVREKLHEQQAQETFETIQRVKETKESHYTYAKTLSQLAFNLIAKQVQAKESVAAVRDDIKTIREAISALEEGRKTRFSILGLDKDIQSGETATTLVVQQYSEEELKSIREKQAAEMSDELADIEREFQEITPDPIEPTEPGET